MAGAPARLLTDVGGAPADRVAALVPLARLENDKLYVHDLWSDSRTKVFHRDLLLDVGQSVFRWLREQGAPIDAALLALELDEVDLARDAVLDSAFVGERFLSPAVIQHLLDRFGGRTSADDPIVLILRSLLVRADPSELENAYALYEQALNQFRAEGNLRGEAAALIGQVDVRWTRGDRFNELQPIFERLFELLDQGVSALDPLAQVVPVLLHDLSGDYPQAFEACRLIDRSTLTPTWANAIDIWTVTLSGLCGHLDVGLAIAEEIYLRTRSDLSQYELVRGTFLSGDPSRALMMRNEGHRLTLNENSNYDSVQVATTWAIMAASWGEAVPLDELNFAPPRSREMAYQAAAHAASFVADHDEDAARRAIATHLNEVGIEDLMSLGELRRWLPIGYILSDELRGVFDREAATAFLGPDHRRCWEIASDLVTMRADEGPEHASPTPVSLFCALPLSWSVEYALRLHSFNPTASTDLLAGLVALIGGSIAEELRSIVSRDLPFSNRALEALRAEPATPTLTTHISTAQSCEVTAGEQSTPVASTPGRLLQALVVRGAMPRGDLASAIWPDSDRDKGAASLRVALNALRKTLEPDRAKGEPSFHLRADEQRIILNESEYLAVDVWKLRHAIAEGRAHETAGRTRSAAASYETVLERWPRELLSALRDVDTFQVDIEALDSELAEAVVRYGELALSIAEPTVARRAALRVLAAQRFEERAYRILIRAALQDGDRVEARRQAESCLVWFDKLGIAPSADTKMTIRLTE